MSRIYHFPDNAMHQPVLDNSGGSSGFGNQPIVNDRGPLIVSEKLPYTITTFTSHKFGAGTDAKVFINLIAGRSTYMPGTGETGPIALEKSKDHKDPFEYGNSDSFTVLARPLDSISQVEIWHDDSGSRADWKLSKVHIEMRGRLYKFRCKQWIKSANEKTVLQLDGLPFVSFDPMQQENRKLHHTEKFKVNDLVLRRGQQFKVKINLSRPFGRDDDFKLVLTTGKRPRVSDKTQVEIEKLDGFEDMNSWKKEMDAKRDKWVFAQVPHMTRDLRSYEYFVINIPGNALPGRYKLNIETDDDHVYTYPNFIYILFNPWSKDDDVYMEEEDLLREYVMAQSGTVYVGSKWRPAERNWYFGQFEAISLETAFNLLEKYKAKDRDSPVEVSRIMSSVVNSEDNNGILMGRWDGDYKAGKNPSSWTSTTAILEEYNKHGIPVRYGQCWVFSACMTTMLRAVGIPCRSVTNFASAHDTNGSCSIDSYLDDDGDEIKGEINGDSVWNFHVWNDVWMARPDLPQGYGGWQAVDATPQERSQGKWQMGPTSLRAVKEGEINQPFDTPFVLAEVNADRMTWQKDKEGHWEVIKRDNRVVGCNISTKDPYSYSRLDVTDLYKFKEGSVMERKSVQTAMMKSRNPTYKVTKKDLTLGIQAKAHMRVGDDIDIAVVAKNESSDILQVSMVAYVEIQRHDGVTKKRLNVTRKSMVVNGEKDSVVHIKISDREYEKYIEDDSLIKAKVFARVLSTDQVVTEDAVIDLEKPTLDLQLPVTGFISNEENEFRVFFTNPLNTVLTNCRMYIDGSIIYHRMYYDNLSNVPAKGVFSHIVKLKPDVYLRRSESKKTLMISFSCDQMAGIYGNAKVMVGSPTNLGDPGFHRPVEIQPR